MPSGRWLWNIRRVMKFLTNVRAKFFMLLSIWIGATDISSSWWLRSFSEVSQNVCSGSLLLTDSFLPLFRQNLSHLEALQFNQLLCLPSVTDSVQRWNNWKPSSVWPQNPRHQGSEVSVHQCCQRQIESTDISQRPWVGCGWSCGDLTLQSWLHCIKWNPGRGYGSSTISELRGTEFDCIRRERERCT